MFLGDSGSGLAILSAVIAAAAAAVAVWRSVVARQQAQEARKSRELSADLAVQRPPVRGGQPHPPAHPQRHHRRPARRPRDRVQLRNYLNHLNFVATLSARHLISDALLKDLRRAGQGLLGAVRQALCPRGPRHPERGLRPRSPGMDRRPRSVRRRKLTPIG